MSQWKTASTASETPHSVLTKKTLARQNLLTLNFYNVFCYDDSTSSGHTFTHTAVNMAEEGRDDDDGAAGGTLKSISDNSFLINYASHERWMIGRGPTCSLLCLLARINDSIISESQILTIQT